MDFFIRNGEIEDAPLIAEAILDAVGPDIVESLSPSGARDEVFSVFERLAKRTDSQYSYLNSRIAVLSDGEPVGVCVSYDGALLHKLRRAFFEEARNSLGWNLSEHEMENFPAETGPEEFYLDSLATLPEFRGRGVATALIKDAGEKARKSGKPLGLLVSDHNPEARKLYDRLGFKEFGKRPFAGEMMTNMRIF